jgi:hypothetical protein
MKNRIINTLKKAADLLLYLLFSFTIFFVSFLVMFLFTKLVLSWPVPAFTIGFALTFYAAKVMNFGWAKEVLNRYDGMVDTAMGKTKKVVKKRKTKKKSGPTGTDGVWEGE